MSRKTNDWYRLIMITSFGIIIGIMVGVSLSLYTLSKLYPGSSTSSFISEDLIPKMDRQLKTEMDQQLKDEMDRQLKDEMDRQLKEKMDRQLKDEMDRQSKEEMDRQLKDEMDRQAKDKIERQLKDKLEQLKGNCSNQNQTTHKPPKNLIHSNPRGAETLPRWIIHSESDLYLRRLWGLPMEDLPDELPKYLVAFTVGQDLMYSIDAAVKKFSENFTIVLFHYDGMVDEWDEFEWSQRTIHISARQQTKWWFTKRFLHPDIVAPYDYIFIWDEDLGLENFDGEKYIELVKKYGLEISQPALDPSTGATWEISLKRDDEEVHKEMIVKPEWCRNPLQPPCAGFVEIMAPVFSREAYRCVWHLIQNDLVHGWGLDFALQKCVEPPYEKIGVVDDQWILHKRVPTLTNQGKMSSDVDVTGKAVKARCEREWKVFKSRIHDAELHEKFIKGSS